MKHIALIALILASGLSSAPNAQEPTTLYTYDCAALMPGYHSQGCQSYNQMVTKGDKDVMTLFKSSNAHVIACFRPEEDVFFLVSYSIPVDSEYQKSKDQKRLEVWSFFTYSRYKDGVQDKDDFLYGAWIKFPTLDLAPSFSAQGTDNSSSVSDSEVSYTNSFQNLSNTTTSYTVQIRLSTLRFSENYTFQETPPPPKSAKAPTPTTPPSQNRITYTGYCTEFKTEASH